MQVSIAEQLRCHRNMVRDHVLVKDINEREIGLRAINAFSQMKPGAEPTAACLDALSRAASSHEAHVGCVAAELLNWLSSDFEVVRNTIRALLHNGNEDARFWAVSAATWNRPNPNSFVVGILRGGLADRNSKVSMHAACKVMVLGINQLLPEMFKMQTSLADPGDLEWCELYIGLLRDGFLVRQMSEGECHMTIRLDTGDLIGWMGKEAEVNNLGAASFAKQLAEQYVADEAQRGANRKMKLEEESL